MTHVDRDNVVSGLPDLIGSGALFAVVTLSLIEGGAGGGVSVDYPVGIFDRDAANLLGEGDDGILLDDGIFVYQLTDDQSAL